MIAKFKPFKPSPQNQRSAPAATCGPLVRQLGRPLARFATIPGIVLLSLLGTSALGTLALGTSALAQQTVYLGGQGTTGVTINLSAIYGSPSASYVAPAPSMQPNLLPGPGTLGGRKLLIPNLRRTAPIRPRAPVHAKAYAPVRAHQPPNLQMPRAARTPIVATRTPVAAPPARPALAKRTAKLPMARLPAPTTSSPSTAPPRNTLAPRSPAPRSVVSPPPPPAPASMAPVKAPAIAPMKAPAIPAPTKLARLAPPPPPPPAVKAPSLNAPPPPRAPLPKAPEIQQPKPMASAPAVPKAPSATSLAPPPPPPTVVSKQSIAKSSPSSSTPGAKPSQTRQRVASLTPSGDDLLQVRFRAGSSVLTRDVESQLKAMAVKIEPTNARLQLKAYAESSGNDTSKARRLSLSRALAVRSFLIENGLRSTRIDVRALGIARDGGAPDRVDILLLDR